MAESYSVEAILSAKDTNFKSTFDEAQSSVSGLQKSADGMTKQGGFLSNVKSVATGMGLFKVASAGVSMISNGIGTLKDEMTESNIAWQTFGGNMGMLGKSEQEIGKVQKSLQQFATETIYGASDMATTYAQMAALGTDNTEQLVKGMGGLAASAENPQQAMKTLSQQMVQALAKPEMQWQDFKLMMEQAPSAMAQVAQHMGMSLDELILSIQDGEIASKDFANAVAEVGTNADFSALATTYKSTGQAIDGLTETVANKLMPAFQAVDKFGIKAVEGLTNWIDNIDIDGAVGLFDEFRQAFTGDSGEGGIAVGVRQQVETIKMSMEEIQGLADGWNGMTLAEKQAQVETMGQEDLDTLMTKLGVDFDSLPNQYHKDAYLNAHGASALEEVLFLTGEWANLTIEEKRAVLEAQIDNEGLEEVIEQRGLWNDEEFITQLAEINMNDDDALQQVTDLINKWGEAEGLDPIKLKVDGKGVRPGIQAIADLVKAGQQAVRNFFEPMSKGFEEIGQAVSNFGSGIKETFRLIGQGDWGRAWDRFKNSTKQAFDSITDSMGKMVSGMWTNIKQLTSDLGDWFSNIDWGGVYDSLDGFFGTIGEKILSVDWKLVGGEIGGSVSDLIGGVESWLDANVPKVIEYAQTVLFNPKSELNISAGEFHDEVMDLFNGFLEGLNIKVPAPVNILDWSYWDAEIQEMTANYQQRLQELRALLENVDQITVKQEVISDIIHLRGEGWDESDIEAWIKEQHSEDAYDITLEAVPELDIREPETPFSNSISNWVDRNTEEVTVEQQVAMLIQAHIAEGGAVGDIEHILRTELGNEVYEATVNASLLIEILEGAGVDPAVIEQVVTSMVGQNEYDIAVNAKVDPQVGIGQLGYPEGPIAPAIGAKIQEGWPSGIPVDITVEPRINFGPSRISGGDATSDVGRDLSAPTIDLSGITAQIQAELSALQTTVNTAMGNINSVILTQASLWGTSVATAMTSMSTSVTSAMTAMTASVLAGMTAMSVSVIVSLTAMTAGVTIAMALMTTAVTASIDSMVATVTAGMETMAEAVTSAIDGMVQGITEGMANAVSAVESAVSSIIGAVEGLYDPMYSAGQSAGQGLADGLNSMQSAVSSAAAALASAANQAAAAAFIINSPSKVWRGFGYSAGEGLVDGLDGSTRSVTRSATSLATAGLPTTRLRATLPSTNISTGFSGQRSKLGDMGSINLLREIKDAIDSGQVIMLDGKQVVGGTAGYMDQALGNISNLGGRHVLA